MTFNDDSHQGHHNGQATTALSETVALDRAVEAVMNITDTGNTLGKNILMNKDCRIGHSSLSFDKNYPQCW